MNRKTPEPAPAASKQRDAVGLAWEHRLQGEGYPAAGDRRFLARFTASPYIQILLRYARPAGGSLILEPGCGSGKFSLALAGQGHQVVTLDYVGEVLQGVKRTEATLAGKWPAKLHGYCQGSLEQLPFADDTFDLVVNEGVVEHWLVDEARLAIIREMVRVARPRGTVAILVPNGMHPVMPTWEARLPAFRMAPPMTCYSGKKLEQELRQAGLHNVVADGIYPWRSWLRLRPWRWLYPIGAALDRCLPLPQALRQRWAINLVGMGRK